MATIGKIEINTLLRRVKVKEGNIVGWFHGFFQEKETSIALIELDNGRVIKEYSDLIEFIEPYSIGTVYEKHD